MPASIEDVRRWLVGDNVKGLPERGDSDEKALLDGKIDRTLVEDCLTCGGEGGVKGEVCKRCRGLGVVKREHPRKSFADRMKDKRRHSKRDFKCEVGKEWDDITLMFGKHKGERLVDLAKSEDGCDYLEWLFAQAIPQKLRKAMVRLSKKT